MKDYRCEFCGLYMAMCWFLGCPEPKPVITEDAAEPPKEASKDLK